MTSYLAILMVPWAGMLEEGCEAFFPLSLSPACFLSQCAGQLQRDLKLLFNVKHMVLPVTLKPSFLRLLKVHMKKNLNLKNELEKVQNYGERLMAVLAFVAMPQRLTQPKAPHSKLKRLPLAGTHLLMTSGSTLLKPQEQGRPGRLCGAALIRCCGGDKTSDSLIDGLTDITIPRENTKWPMPGPDFSTAGRGAEPPTMQSEGSHQGELLRWG